MNTNYLVAGVGRSISIWPDEDYNQFVPTVRPSAQAWLNISAQMSSALKTLEKQHPELEKVKQTYKQSISYDR